MCKPIDQDSKEPDQNLMTVGELAARVAQPAQRVPHRQATTPLRETLIAQTGETPQLRWEYLKKVDRIATDFLPGERWKTEEREAPAF